jgi:hypothetical protein
MKAGLRKNTIAFSAVIASLILMLLAVAAGVVVYAYVMGWIGSAQQNPTSTGKLQIDSIVTNSTRTGINIYVRNVGGVSLTLNATYVDGVLKSNATALQSDLWVQKTEYLEIGMSPAMTKNVFYEVKVVCTDGTMVSTSVQAK